MSRAITSYASRRNDHLRAQRRSRETRLGFSAARLILFAVGMSVNLGCSIIVGHTLDDKKASHADAGVDGPVADVPVHDGPWLKEGPPSEGTPPPPKFCDDQEITRGPGFGPGSLPLPASWEVTTDSIGAVGLAFIPGLSGRLTYGTIANDGGAGIGFTSQGLEGTTLPALDTFAVTVAEEAPGPKQDTVHLFAANNDGLFHASKGPGPQDTWTTSGNTPIPNGPSSADWKITHVAAVASRGAMPDVVFVALGLQDRSNPPNYHSELFMLSDKGELQPCGPLDPAPVSPTEPHTPGLAISAKGRYLLATDHRGSDLRLHVFDTGLMSGGCPSQIQSQVIADVTSEPGEPYPAAIFDDHPGGTGFVAFEVYLAGVFDQGAGSLAAQRWEHSEDPANTRNDVHSSIIDDGHKGAVIPGSINLLRRRNATSNYDAVTVTYARDNGVTKPVPPAAFFVARMPTVVDEWKSTRINPGNPFDPVGVKTALGLVAKDEKIHIFFERPSNTDVSTLHHMCIDVP